MTTSWQLIKPLESHLKLFIVCTNGLRLYRAGQQKLIFGEMKWQYSGWRMHQQIFFDLFILWGFFDLWLFLFQMPAKKIKSYRSQLSFMISDSRWIFPVWPFAYHLKYPKSGCIKGFFKFFYQKAKAEVSRKPQEEWLIPAQCRKLLSGASVAAAEVYHHGYLISQRRLRDQQGQFSALSTLLSFFDVVRRHPLDLVSHNMSAQRKSPERKT